MHTSISSALTPLDTASYGRWLTNAVLGRDFHYTLYIFLIVEDERVAEGEGRGAHRSGAGASPRTVSTVSTPSGVAGDRRLRGGPPRPEKDVLTTLWVAIVAVALANAVVKAAGPLLVGGRELPPRVVAVIELLAPALLATLAVSETFAQESASCDRRAGHRGGGRRARARVARIGADHGRPGRHDYRTGPRLRLSSFASGGTSRP